MGTSTPTGRSLRARVRGVRKEIGQFGTVGAFGFLVNAAVFNLFLTRLHWQPGRSGVLATLVAIAVNYVGYRYWVYRTRDRAARTREITLFLAFSGIGLVIENGTLMVSHYGLGLTTHLDDNLAKNIVGLGLGTLFRFVSYRTWVFRALPAAVPLGAAEQSEPVVPAVAAGGPGAGSEG